MLTSVEDDDGSNVIRFCSTREILWIDKRFPGKPLLGYRHGRNWDRTLGTQTLDASHGITPPLFCPLKSLTSPCSTDITDVTNQQFSYSVRHHTLNRKPTAFNRAAILSLARKCYQWLSLWTGFLPTSFRVMQRGL